MTLGDWIKLQAVVVSLWPHAPRLTSEQLAAQHELVRGVSLQDATDAIHRLAVAGREFPPPPGVVVAEAAQGSRHAVWSEARDVLCRASGKFGRNREAEALEWIEERSPTAARMAVEVGWRQWCREELDSPDHGGAVNARLQSVYAGVVAQERQERAEGRLVPLVERRLAVLNGGGEADGLRRPNFGELAA